MDEQLGAWLLFEQIAQHARRTEVVTFEVAGRRTHRTRTRRRGASAAADARARWPAFRRARRSQRSPGTATGISSAISGFRVPVGSSTRSTSDCPRTKSATSWMMPATASFSSTPTCSPVLSHATEGFASIDTVVVFGAFPGAARQTSCRTTSFWRPAGSYPWRRIDERATLGLCYTSGTTGSPKGVAYTHRSTFLHAFAATSATACRVGPGDTVLPMVPMFHASAWGLPYAAAPPAPSRCSWPAPRNRPPSSTC